jgi:phosphoglycolate phosphatase-like HAD superfamily hydrolase
MKYVLLDLDGTLVDPARGIIGACQSALLRLGEPFVHESELLSAVVHDEGNI